MVFLLLNICLFLLDQQDQFFFSYNFCLGINVISKSSRNIIKLSKKEKIIIYSTFAFSLAYCFYQIKTNMSYISFTVNNFV